MKEKGGGLGIAYSYPIGRTKSVREFVHSFESFACFIILAVVTYLDGTLVDLIPNCFSI